MRKKEHKISQLSKFVIEKWRWETQPVNGNQRASTATRVVGWVFPSPALSACDWQQGLNNLTAHLHVHSVQIDNKLVYKALERRRVVNFERRINLRPVDTECSVYYIRGVCAYVKIS